MVTRLGACVLFLFLAVLGCGGSAQSLTDAQLQKLDPALRRLVQGETPEQEVPTMTRSDGTVVYPVFIRTTNAERVREAEIPINSVSGNILTARLSKSEIRKAARLEVVVSIRSSGRATPDPSK